ncbi:MAG: hypothetical protein K6G51_05450 [Sphaerochaetaceae bacterium]|nr:hypothetical protein [Sphaerochaetaceae bacterium]
MAFFLPSTRLGYNLTNLVGLAKANFLKDSINISHRFIDGLTADIPEWNERTLRDLELVKKVLSCVELVPGNQRSINDQILKQVQPIMTFCITAKDILKYLCFKKIVSKPEYNDYGVVFTECDHSYIDYCDYKTKDNKEIKIFKLTEKGTSFVKEHLYDIYTTVYCHNIFGKHCRHVKAVGIITERKAGWRTIKQFSSEDGIYDLVPANSRRSDRISNEAIMAELKTGAAYTYAFSKALSENRGVDSANAFFRIADDAAGARSAFELIDAYLSGQGLDKGKDIA